MTETTTAPRLADMTIAELKSALRVLACEDANPEERRLVRRIAAELDQRRRPRVFTCGENEIPFGK